MSKNKNRYQTSDTLPKKNLDANNILKEFNKFTLEKLTTKLKSSESFTLEDAKNILDLSKTSRKLSEEDDDIKKLLIVYTGGTIGMMKTEHGYVPKKYFLLNFMYNHPNLCDKEFTVRKNNKSSSNALLEDLNIHSGVYTKKKQKITSFQKYRGNLNFKLYAKEVQRNNSQAKLIFKVDPCCTTPRSNLIPEDDHETSFNSDGGEGVNTQVNQYSLSPSILYTAKNHLEKRICYQLLEFNEVIDSSNINVNYTNQIGQCIADHYDKYDGFVILHGTDTMSYSASMISFMLENISKPVIFTGSQIPLAEMSNDGLANLINAINICGSYPIPEVGILFSGKLLRANRSIKNDNQGLNAFETPNIEPLIVLGTKIKINKHLILKPPSQSQKFSFQKIKDVNINPFKYIPYINDDSIRNQLSDKLDGVIIESYGAGNLPSNRHVLTECLRKLIDTKVIIVNVSQCKKGLMSADYEVGKQLESLGIVYGSDMTFECAQAKLTYFLSKGYSKSDIKCLFNKI
jgi:60kDa lysophospholipase